MIITTTKAFIAKDLEAPRDAGDGGTLLDSVADATRPWLVGIGRCPSPEVVSSSGV